LVGGLTRNGAVGDPELSEEVYFARFGAIDCRRRGRLALMRLLRSPAATLAGNLELSGEEKVLSR
jgi:hypothetical protein